LKTKGLRDCTPLNCESRARVAIGNRAGQKSSGYIDRAGRYVFEPQVRVVGASPFTEGLACLTLTRTWYERLSPLN